MGSPGTVEGRAGQGAAGGESDLLALPYVRLGPRVKQWAVRACTYERFIRAVLQPRAGETAPRPVHVVDLGAGNGWLCYRIRRRGHRAVAVDMRADDVDGLGAGAAYAAHLASMFGRVAAAFESLPLAADAFDIAVFNAALHCTYDLQATLAEAARVVAPGGRIAILDSPFYASAEDGDAMVAENRSRAVEMPCGRADHRTEPPPVEYLTAERLERASAGLDLRWRRFRVWYPLWYETRRLMARLRRERAPSRFDLWEARV